MPMIKNRTRGILEPLLDRYTRVYNQFIYDDNELKGLPPDPKKAAHRKKLFGETYDLIAYTPDEYSVLSMALSLGSLHEWNQLTLHEQAQLIAHKRISNMIETLDRHLEIIKQNLEEMRNKKNKHGQNSSSKI